MTTTELRCWRPGLELFEDPDDLRFAEAGLFTVSLLGHLARDLTVSIGANSPPQVINRSAEFVSTRDRA